MISELRKRHVEYRVRFRVEQTQSIPRVSTYRGVLERDRRPLTHLTWTQGVSLVPRVRTVGMCLSNAYRYRKGALKCDVF